jgi:acyl-CoA thioesterase-1
MKRAIVIAGILASLVAGAALAWRLVRRRRARGMDRLAQSLPVHSKFWRDHAKREGELLYVVVGDSAAQGIGASKPTRGYVGAIVRRLRETSGKSVRVVNLSVSGARLREALAVQVPRLVKLRPDVLTVAIGANDIATFDAERFDRELRELFAVLPQHAIVGDVPSFHFPAAERKVRLANGILHQAAGEFGLTVASVYTATRRQGVFLAALNQASADFFHPNDRGYRVWASAFLPHIDEAAARLRDESSTAAPEAPFATEAPASAEPVGGTT